VLYAYKHGDYQRCLQLSTQNVHTLLYAVRVYDFAVLPNVIQLLNDDIVSLTALMIMVKRDRNDHNCDDINITQHHNNNHWDDIDITQLTPSLYLMAQCQLKLHHSVTSLSQTLDYIKVAQSKHRPDRTLDKLAMKLIERKVVAYISTFV